MDINQLEKDIRDTFLEIYDPEIPVNIWDLGLIYDVSIEENGNVSILMTLTAPGCPTAAEIVAEVEERIGTVEGVEAVEVELTFEPPWTMEMMSEEARLELGFL